VTFTARPYDDIVRDMLTTLTKGTVREVAVVPAVAPGAPLLVPLTTRPVRRVSFVEGQINVTVTKADPNDATKKIKAVERRTYRFTAADFELIATSGDESRKDAIRFRDKGQKPVAGTNLVINYYPVQTDPVPLTDVAVGSVIRTILETIGIELALTYQQLEQVYKSAFVETAEGDALDKVVALTGVQRMPSGRAVARLRFTRAGGAAGTVTIPVATPVTDAKANRYLTTSEVTMAPGESTKEVTAAAESDATQEVAKDQLTFLEVAIAGVSTVTNPDPSRKLAVAETDDQLRLRARSGFRAASRGTLDAIRFGLLGIQGVKDVKITERPNGVPGEIRVDVAFASDATPEIKALVAERLELFRPAGIHVETGEAAHFNVSVKVSLTLQGASISGGDLETIQAAAAEKIKQILNSVPPEGKVRRAPLVAAVMSDSRVVDAKVTLTPENQSPVEELTLPAATVLKLVEPVVFDSPAFEQSGTAAQVTSKVSMSLPLNLAGNTTQPEAQGLIESAAAAHLATRSASAPLTVDSFATAVRNDAKYALVRSEVLLTVEGQGVFRQLTDALGSYAPATNETLVNGAVTLDVRGSV
jgi:uncharacterized phage protein gp47/JayE